MAGLYIRWVKGLSRRREVLLIARQLGISNREAACCCMEVWEWADDETADGTILGATEGDVDAIVNVPGFARAMCAQNVGWLVVFPDRIVFPRWDKNNGENAKKREYERQKKRRQRDLRKIVRRKKCPENVPVENGDKKGTVPENLFSLSSLPLPSVFQEKECEFRTALEAWVAFKHAKRQDYTDRGLRAQVSLAGKRAAEHGVQAVIDAMEKAMAEDWKGWDHESSFVKRVNGHDRDDPRGNVAAMREYLDRKAAERGG